MSIKNLSITKVKLAFECPRLLYLSHYFGGVTMFYPPPNNKVSGIGNDFHSLADRCIQYALKKPDLLEVLTQYRKPLDEEEINLAIGNKIYQNVFFPYLQTARSNSPEKVKNLEYIWQGLTQLIKHWTELIIKNMEYCPVEKVIRKTFIAKEYKLSHTFSLPHGREQLIKGKLDSLIFDFQHHRLCVVEYKTYHPVDPTAQFAQVALYSYILHKSQSIPIDAQVFCVSPEFKQYIYSWQELEKSIYGLIPHKLQQIQQWLAWQPDQFSPPPPTSQPDLCNRCPQQKRCRSFFR
ncbi:MAG: hypothetical protein N5P05_002506 [Chroococcopsis gigantea SAG 12.99]|jgi:S-DNA-T family DNA segregation ATPase FtsK/SpoIIIE|nr:hypothetical protein [Chroococcopsis gigantea SAG 12.99]